MSDAAHGLPRGDRSPTRLLNGSTSQRDRLRSAPRPEGVSVDGRSLAQLLAFAARYGALIQFYDLDGLPRGDWTAFFAGDPAIAKAMHGALDLPDLDRALRRLVDEVRRAASHRERQASLRRAIALVVRLLDILDGASPSTHSDAEHALRERARRPRRDGLSAPLAALDAHWSSGPGATWTVLDIEMFEAPWRETLLERFEDLCASLLEELRHGATEALRAAEASLGGRGHAPQAALYNAFVLLYDDARQALNRFPRRLLDFYYGDVLEQHQRAAEPDRVFLAFTLAPGVAEAAVPRATPFSAGVDAHGAAILYAADTALAVVPTTVVGLGVHRTTYRDGETSAATGVLSGNVEPGPAGTGLPVPFPMFGRDEPGTFGSLTLTPASVGFIVASQTLMLCGGTRTIRIVLTPVPASGQAAADPVDGAQPPAAAPADGLQSQLLSAQGLAALAQPAFALHYSTAAGWIEVESFSVTPAAPPTPGGAITLTFDIVLPPDAPPLVAPTTRPAIGAPPPTLPASAFPDTDGRPAIVAQLRSCIDKTGAIPYAVLSLLEIAAITLDVKVEDLAPAALSSPAGPIDPSRDFAVFGLSPVRGATLAIVAPELFVKTVDAVSVSIRWAGLPVTSTGFQGYYQGYVIDADGQLAAQPLFDNASFQVGLGVVSPGTWRLDARTPFALFQTAVGPGATTARTDTGTDTGTGTTSGTAASGATAMPLVDVPVLPVTTLAAATVTSDAPPPYYAPASSALSLTLAAPSYAFGNVLYASNLMAASTAGVAALRAASAPAAAATTAGTTAPITRAATVNAAATDRAYAPAMKTAVSQAVSALNGKALASLQTAVTGSGAASATKAGWLEDLDAALRGRAAAATSSMLGRLGRRFAQGWLPAADENAVTERLKAWIAAREADLGARLPLLRQAKALLRAAEGLAQTFASLSQHSPAVARPTMSAALHQAQAALAQADAQGAQANGATLASALPNAPWLPMASSVTLGYAARAGLAALGDASPSGDGQDDDDDTSPATAVIPFIDEFLHLCPFSRAQGASHGPTRRVALLPTVGRRAALYIDLSAFAAEVALLFILQAGPDGWSNEMPVVVWEQRVGNDWCRIDVLGDDTNALMNSGIVTLRLDARTGRQGAAPPRLRVRLVEGMDHSPLVKAVIANALTATWMPPGGAARLGDPLPAGTITQSTAALTGIATISQPMASIGGHPAAVGQPFDLWMAERLRHKGFAITAWDYARLALAAVPSLWQLGVVPAFDEASGRPSPGHVWLVAVAGPRTPNIDDATVPVVDPTVLAEIGELLQRVASPFVKLRVTNPPYARLTVHADLVFSADDTVDAWLALLQGELVRWLSPWPDPSLGPRPADYFGRQAIARFIRGRPYVRGIASLRVHPDPDVPAPAWRYLTSALRHALRGTTARDADNPAGAPRGRAEPAHAATRTGRGAAARRSLA